MSTKDCIFCAIVDGDIPSHTVAETDHALAFLDVNPLAPGHTLVIPKDHYQTVDAVPPTPRNALFELVGSLTGEVEEAVDADASTIGINNGSVAGQEVPHVHAHIIPRFAGDGGGPIHHVAGSAPELSDTEMDDIAGTIRDIHAPR